MLGKNHSLERAVLMKPAFGLYNSPCELNSWIIFKASCSSTPNSETLARTLFVSTQSNSFCNSTITFVIVRILSVFALDRPVRMTSTSNLPVCLSTNTSFKTKSFSAIAKAASCNSTFKLNRIFAVASAKRTKPSRSLGVIGNVCSFLPNSLSPT